MGATPISAKSKKPPNIVDRTNDLEAEFEALSDEALRAKTDEFRQRLAQELPPPAEPIPDENEEDAKAEAEELRKVEQEVLNEILPEAFAVVREAAKRTIGQRHYDVQLIGGIVLHQGKIAEMRTGEGKTLVATLPLYLNALAGKGVHLVTVNDYLARRDARWMGAIYHFLGLSVGILQMAAATENGKKAFLYDPDRAVAAGRPGQHAPGGAGRGLSGRHHLRHQLASSASITCAITWSTAMRTRSSAAIIMPSWTRWITS